MTCIKRWVSGAVSGASRGAASVYARLVVAVALVAAFPAWAFADDPLIPDTGIDLSAFATEAITGLGAVIATGVAGYFGFLLVRKGIRWIGRLVG